MNILRRSIKHKLLGGFGILAVIVVAVSAFALNALENANQAFISYTAGINARANTAAQIRNAVDRRAIAARNLVLVTKPDDITLETTDVQSADADVQRYLAQLQTLLTNATDASPKAHQLAANIAEIESRYGPVARDIVKKALNGQREEATLEIDDKCRPLLAELERATNAYADYVRTQESDIAQINQDRFTQTRMLMFGVCAAAVVLAAISGLWITRSITRPLSEAVRVARTVADGDLTSRIEVRGHDETRDLLEALDTMNTRLSDIVARVREGSSGIALAVGEIAAGNVDLSVRTEEQAASLQETAATMEELTSTVRLNAENAQQASSFASSASEVAQRGSHAVGRVVDTMNDIGERSSKIADITGMIEGIAFQTNILALNAAVEAARAGEQGRGFAVVASEVRSLAQRSSAAAKEIKELITASVQTVRDGSVLAGDAGRTMAEITQAVARVTDIMGEIAAASAEQSRGIDQVNLTITQMDETTQQNAALVEQAAAASKSLEAQGRQLDETVSTFRVEQGRRGGNAAAEPIRASQTDWRMATV
ncbi:methyl-accepting chemotaxis protein [Burkholderia sp. 22PA0099]|uniref:methyl-accepting chemotaxis protein n=1 Tax=Burkholderia sp. 22PA0099 TaxID=3237372 RepID=UPI0039C0B300